MRAEKLLGLLLIVLSGCAQPVKDLTGLFNEQDFQWSSAAGTASLRGQAFARTNSGDVKPCAGLEIYLVPETTYTRSIVIALEDGYRRFAPNPPAFAKYRRATLGDATGGFRFERLPPGKWYVGCDLSWMTSCSGFSCTWTGARIERKVELTAGETLEVVVTPDTVPKERPERPMKKCPNFPWWC